MGTLPTLMGNAYSTAKFLVQLAQITSPPSALPAILERSWPKINASRIHPAIATRVAQTAGKL